MPAYRILVANPFRQPDDWGLFCTRLQEVFEPAIEASPDFDSCEVVHRQVDDGERGYRLVLYMVPDPSLSMCARRFHVSAEGNHAGLTYFIRRGTRDGRRVLTRPEAVSEVYYRVETNARRRPYLAYHEALHNVLMMGNEMHRRHGLAASVPEIDHRREANTRLMGRRLRQTPVQWFGGFEVARQIELDMRGLDGL